MNTSTYYDLKLYEGSDIVNPLVVDVPNLEAIDEIMHDNAVESVGLATELTSGAVHAITRENPDAAVFRFVATSNWTAGDTMTVDGIQVTVLLPSGESLGSGAYVINSNVLGIITGTLVTLFTSGGLVTTAQDSEKLGGELPEFYATAESVETAQSTASAAGQIAQANQQAIANLQQQISGLSNPPLVQLWSNSNPSAAYANQTVNIDLTDYRVLFIGFYRKAGQSTLVTRTCPKGMVNSVTDIIFDNANTISTLTRVITPSNTGVAFSAGVRATLGVTGGTTDNTVMIPVVIYGMK